MRCGNCLIRTGRAMPRRARPCSRIPATATSRPTRREGVDDLVVVATQDAVLVSRQKDANGLKRLVAKLKTVAPQVTEDHLKVHRPWGFLSIGRHRRASPGQAHRGEAGRAAVAAEASPSLGSWCAAPRGGRRIHRRERRGPRGAASKAGRRKIGAMKRLILRPSKLTALTKGPPGSFLIDAFRLPQNAQA
jgi:hypothetical protein